MWQANTPNKDSMQCRANLALGDVAKLKYQLTLATLP